MKRFATLCTIVVATVGLAVVPAPEPPKQKQYATHIILRTYKGESVEDAAKEALGVARRLNRFISWDTGEEVGVDLVGLIVGPDDTEGEIIERYYTHLAVLKGAPPP